MPICDNGLALQQTHARSRLIVTSKLGCAAYVLCCKLGQRIRNDSLVESPGLGARLGNVTDIFQCPISGHGDSKEIVHQQFGKMKNIRSDVVLTRIIVDHGHGRDVISCGTSNFWSKLVDAVAQQENLTDAIICNSFENGLRRTAYTLNSRIGGGEETSKFFDRRWTGIDSSRRHNEHAIIMKVLVVSFAAQRKAEEMD